MPNDGFLAILTKQFSRPSSSTCREVEQDCILAESDPPTRPTTPWNLDTLDEELRRTQSEDGAADSGREEAGRGAAPLRSLSLTTSDSSLLSIFGIPRKASGKTKVTKLRAKSAPIRRNCRPSSAFSRSLAKYRSGFSRSSTSDVTTLPMNMNVPPTTSSFVSGPRTVASSRFFFAPPVVSPIYAREEIGPTRVPTRCTTPLWDFDTEKRVRFLEPEVTGDYPSRPSTASSYYSGIVKNATRFTFPTTEDLFGSQGHNVRHCNCPCHYLSSPSPTKRTIGVQVLSRPKEHHAPSAIPHRTPRTYRLLVLPSLSGLEGTWWGAKSAAFAIRALLSQIGFTLILAAWWLLGAIVFSAVEGPKETATIARMSRIKGDMVVDLATELRQVRPHEYLWRAKIETYMNRFETALLEAARAGYGSRTPAWTLSGGFLYAASLTLLIGPSGMMVRTSFSKLFAFPFTVVGASLLFLLVLSGGHAFRDGVTWLHSYHRRRHQVQEQERVNQYTSSDTPGTSGTLNVPRPAMGSIEVDSTPYTPTDGTGPPLTESSPITTPPKVRPLGNSLKNGSNSTSSEESPPPQLTEEATAIQAATGQSDDMHEESSTTIATTSTAVVVEQQPQPRSQDPPSSSLRPVPWWFFLTWAAFYLAVGIGIFGLLQKWSPVSAFYILSSSSISADHGGVGERRLFASSVTIIFYVAYLLLAYVNLTAFLISTWPVVSAAALDVEGPVMPSITKLEEI